MHRICLFLTLTVSFMGLAFAQKARYQIADPMAQPIDVVLGENQLFTVDEEGVLWRVDQHASPFKLQKLAEGLNAPGGLAYHDGLLYVTCKEYVAKIVVDSGQVTRMPIRAAQLVGIAVGPNGYVYVSDRAANRIYRLRDDRVETFKRGPSLHQPNGLACLYEQLYMACQGGSEVQGAIRVMPLEPESDNNLWSEPMGRLYGLAGDGEFGFFVSDHIKGVIFHVHADGTTRRLFSVPEPKGLAYDADAQRLWIASSKGLLAYDASP